MYVSRAAGHIALGDGGVAGVPVGRGDLGSGVKLTGAGTDCPFLVCPLPLGESFPEASPFGKIITLRLETQQRQAGSHSPPGLSEMLSREWGPVVTHQVWYALITP